MADYEISCANNRKQGGFIAVLGRGTAKKDKFLFEMVIVLL